MNWDKKQQIDEILLEASSYGLRDKVVESANQYLIDDPELDEVEAYEMAFVQEMGSDDVIYE